MLSRHEYAKINYVYTVSSLNTAVHSLPHVNSSYYVVNDYYEKGNQAYEEALTNLSYMPLILVIILLVLALGNLLAKVMVWEENPDDLCNCIKVKAMKYLTYGCLVAIIICLLLEILIVLKGMSAHKRYYIPWTALPIYKFTKVFDETTEHFGFGWAFMDYGDVATDRSFKNNSLANAKKLYAQFATEVQTIWKDIKAPEQSDRVILTPFMSAYLKFVWKRFFICVIGWFSGIGVALCRPNRFWLTSVVGVLWCCLASMVLMRTTVMVADICMDPDYFVKQLVDERELKRTLYHAIDLLCEQFKYLSERSKPRLPEVYFKYQVEFQTAIDNLKSKVTALQNLDDYGCMSADHRCKYLMKVKNFIVRKRDSLPGVLDLDPEEINSCAKMQRYPEDQPHESLVDLCDGDPILQLLLVQLVTVLVATAMFFAILMVHITTATIILGTRRVVIEFLKISKKMKKVLLMERRRYPHIEETLKSQATIKKSRKRDSPDELPIMLPNKDGSPRTLPDQKDRKVKKRLKCLPKCPSRLSRTRTGSSKQTKKTKPEKSSKRRKVRTKDAKTLNRSRSRSASFREDTYALYDTTRSAPKKTRFRKRRKINQQKMLVVDIDKNTKVLVPLKHDTSLDGPPTPSSDRK